MVNSIEYCGLDVEGFWFLFYVVFVYWCLIVIDLEGGI